MTEPQHASTVIIARDTSETIEVFLLRRSSKSSFVPDVYVFPGGRVDVVDRSPAARMRVTGETKPLEPADVYAAARESFEEAGLLFGVGELDPAAVRTARTLMLAGSRSFEQTLDDLRTTVDAHAMRYFSRWITPAVEPRRFDARFFIARAPIGQTAEADSFETEDGRWIAPADALAATKRGELAMIFPTIKHLERIARYTTVDDLLAFALAKSIVPVTPDVRDGPEFFLPPTLEGAW